MHGVGVDADCEFQILLWFVPGLVQRFEWNLVHHPWRSAVQLWVGVSLESVQGRDTYANRSSIVGLSYVACCLGVIGGYVPCRPSWLPKTDL